MFVLYLSSPTVCIFRRNVRFANFNQVPFIASQWLYVLLINDVFPVDEAAVCLSTLLSGLLTLLRS